MQKLSGLKASLSRRGRFNLRRAVQNPVQIVGQELVNSGILFVSWNPSETGGRSGGFHGALSRWAAQELINASTHPSCLIGCIVRVVACTAANRIGRSPTLPEPHLRDCE